MIHTTRHLVYLLSAAFVIGCAVHSIEVKTASSVPDHNLMISGDEESAAAAPRDHGATRLETCDIPEGLKASTLSPGFPAVVGEGLETERASALILLGPDGTASIMFEMVVKNPSAVDAEALVGYVWRTRGAGEGKDFATVEFDSTKTSTCSASGPREARQPHTDIAFFTSVTVSAGQTSSVKGSYSIPLRQFDKPESIFGYEDRFSRNWKNWDWPYTKAEPYARIADDLRPYVANFATVSARATQITLAPADGRSNWMRSMSFEQNVTMLRKPGTYRWDFGADDLPSTLRFEYLPGLDIKIEMKVFEEIAAANPDDLRAMIRLADLNLFGGDTSERIEILGRLLDHYDGAAGEQMLSGSNDVRAAAHVAIVRSLMSMKKVAEAREAASRGMKTIADLDARTDLNRLAAIYLKSVLEK